MPDIGKKWNMYTSFFHYGGKALAMEQLQLEALTPQLIIDKYLPLLTPYTTGKVGSD